MVPDTRMSHFLMVVSVPSSACSFILRCNQHEAHSDPHVPFFGYELWALQEDGDIRK
jgi:hypothetical protein